MMLDKRAWRLTSWLLYWILCCVPVGSGAFGADINDVKAFDIRAQTLDLALIDFSKQAGFQIVSNGTEVGKTTAPAVTGSKTVAKALEELLAGSGLSFRVVGPDVIAVDRGRGRSVPVVPGAPGSTSDASGRGAQMQEKVLVTAQKRSELVTDVPAPVTVIRTDKLSENNQVRLREFFDSVPGFNVAPTPTGGNQQVLSVRGITAGIGGNPTVGIVVDDVPYGAFTREFALDLDPSDLERIELLRGPQGTLYGANSMGGLLKYVTIDPSTGGVRGRFEGGFSSVHNGNELGYTLRGAINFPLSDTLAVRASAFTRRDPGYIDNPRLGTEAVNSDQASGARLSALWRPSDNLSLKVSALYQDIKYDGLSEVDILPGLGDLQQSKLPGVGASTQKTQAYSAVLNGNFGGVDVTSVTGYNVFQVSTSNDYTFLQSARAQLLFGVPGAEQFTRNKTSKVTEEIRAVVPIGQRFEWLLGGFYSHEENPLTQGYNAMDPVTGVRVGTFSTLDIPIKFTEYAVFTNLTVHVTDRFDVQFGGRESYMKLNFEPVISSPAPGVTPVVLAAITSSPKVFTYLVTPQFKVSPRLMVYGRVASGYRPSRSNSFNPDPEVPRTANPDKTQTYEVGAKGETADQMFSFDASLYHIDWKDLQIALLNTRNNLVYFTNGSRAKSEGVELAIAARPLPGLRVAASGSYDNAVLSEGFPANTTAFGPAGSRLPFGARLAGSLSLDQEFPLGGAVGFAGVTVNYVGERFGPFIATPARAVYPAYSKVDLRAGARFGRWSVHLYAKNVGDKRAVLAGGAGTLPPFANYYLQPRTIGMSVVRTF